MPQTMGSSEEPHITTQQYTTTIQSWTDESMAEHSERWTPETVATNWACPRRVRMPQARSQQPVYPPPSAYTAPPTQHTLQYNTPTVCATPATDNPTTSSVGQFNVHG